MKHALVLATQILLFGFTTLARVYAVDLYATPSGVPVSANVPEQSFNAPILIDPSNNAVTKNPKEPFSWYRPTPLPASSLDHYDLYIDDALFAQGIPDGTNRTEYYSYTIDRKDNVFYVYPKTDRSEGYHTWKVVAYTSSNISSQSETRRFYIDSVVPFIKLTSVDTNQIAWDTSNPSSIPSAENRYLYTSADPLLSGTTEPGVNLQFTLLCPPQITSCNSLTQIFNYPSGSFHHRFYNLLPNHTYTVYLSATDSAGNSVIMPPFYLIYFVEIIS